MNDEDFDECPSMSEQYEVLLRTLKDHSLDCINSYSTDNKIRYVGFMSLATTFAAIGASMLPSHDKRLDLLVAMSMKVMNTLYDVENDIYESN